MLLCCNLEVSFQHVKQYSEKQYVQASEHACQEFRNLVDYLVKKFSYVALHQQSCLNWNLCNFNFGNSFIGHFVTIKMTCFWCYQEKNSLQNHDNFLIFSVCFGVWVSYASPSWLVSFFSSGMWSFSRLTCPSPSLESRTTIWPVWLSFPSRKNMPPRNPNVGRTSWCMLPRTSFT